MLVSKKIGLNELKMDTTLELKNNYDIIKNGILIANKEACFYYVDGFLKDKIMTDIKDALFDIDKEELSKIKNIKEFSEKFINYSEVNFESEFESIFKWLLSGCVILFIDGYEEALIIDIREYPARSIEEPENDKVLRGAKDGFLENPIVNITLIRRRIRNVNLRFEHFNIGNETNNDVVISYIKGKVDDKKLEYIKKRLKEINPKSLTMGTQSLAEALVPKKWINPFPKVKFTARPDIASSNLLEGRVILIVDNTPSVAILPTYFFDFFQEAEDYYFPPPIGNFIRFSRFFIAFISTVITPIWLLIIKNIESMPQWLQVFELKEASFIPIVIQLLLLEFAIEALRAASINTPAMISTSIALIGTIILGDIAVVSKLIMPEALLYTGFATIGFYCQSSFEFGYAMKYIRMMLIILIGLFNWYGAVFGAIITILMICFNKTITTESYIYPLIPFNFQDLKKTFIRTKNS